MKEWFIFSQIIFVSIISLILIANFVDCFSVVLIFSSFSFITFLLTIFTLLIILFNGCGINQIIYCLYLDIRRLAMLITDSAYSPALPIDIIAQNSKKMSIRLRKIRESIMINYISSWWGYISPTRQFEVQIRLRLTHVLEILAARFSSVSYAHTIIAVIRLKVGLKRASGGASLRRIAEVDPEKYFSCAFYEIMSVILEEEELDIHSLREWLSEMLATSVAVPLLDLCQTPHIIFNAIIALLVRDQNDIAQYVSRVQLARNSVNIDTSNNQPSFISQSLRSALSSMSLTDMHSIASSKKNDSGETNNIDTFHTISNIHISDTFRSTDLKSGSQFTMYIIRFTHVVSSGRGQLSNMVKTVHRRYKEFINLHHMLSDLPDYKGIRGPSSLDQMFLNNFSPARINVRKDFLENYLKSMIERQGLLNNEIVHRFLGIKKFSADQPFENLSKPLNVKIKKKWNDLIERLSDKLPDYTKDLQSDRDCESISEKEDKNVNESTDPQDEINKMLTSLSKLSCHQNPAFPCQVPDFEYQHPLIQSNYRHLTDNYLSLYQNSTSAAPLSSIPSHNVSIPPPPIISEECTPSTATHMPISYISSPFVYGPNDPVPFLLSFRLLALQYRDSTCRNWRPHEGPVLTRTGGFFAKWERLFWQLLGCAADPIIQWSFEDLLRSSYVADYLELFQELLWPSGKSNKSLATFAMNSDIVHLRQAAAQSIADALPKIAYLFVNKDELIDLIDSVLTEFQNPQSNRLLFFQLFQILIEEHLFRDVFNPSNH